jgi:Ca2+-binding EF-hand superfamily protein
MELKRKFRCQFKGITKAFRALDLDHDGHIDHFEFRQLLVRYNIDLPDHEFKRLMKMYDMDGNGEIEMNEFLQDFGKIISGGKGSVDMKEDANHILGIRTAKHRDERQRHLGLLSVAEADKQLRQKCLMRSRETQRLFRMFDQDRDGSVDRQEFMKVLTSFNLYLSPADFSKLWAIYDVNKDGRSSITSRSYTVTHHSVAHEFIR